MTNPKTLDRLAKQREERIRKASERTGFRPGRYHIRVTDGQGQVTLEDYVVEVDFYPKERWYYRRIRTVEVNKPDCKYEYRLDKKRTPLTKELWDRMETLRL